MKESLVSVIVPTYNVEKYIRVCLKKVLAQTYHNYEIIIVDDGSTDKTVEICEKKAQSDKRVKIIKAVHGGVSKARNIGLDKAEGDLVVFFDADDYPESTILEEYVKAHENWGDSVSFILCGMFWENYKDRLIPREKHILEEARGFVEGNNYLLQNHDVSMLSWNKIFNFITNKCYLMSVIRKYNLRFKEDVHIAEDMQFNLDYLEISNGDIGVINKPLYHYVKHGDVSLSGSYYDGAIDHVCQSFDRLLAFVKSQPGVSAEDVYVIKSIYLMDWVSRLSMYMDDKNSDISKKERFKACNDELRKPKFRKILKDSYKGRKIRGIRYLTLRMCRFEWFYVLRKFYHRFRREKWIK